MWSQNADVIGPEDLCSRAATATTVRFATAPACAANAAPRDRQRSPRADKLPKPADRAAQIRDEEYPEDTAQHRMISARNGSLSRSALRNSMLPDPIQPPAAAALFQKFLGKIDRNHIACGTDAFGRRRTRRCRTNIESIHAGKERQTIYSPLKSLASLQFIQEIIATYFP